MEADPEIASAKPRGIPVAAGKAALDGSGLRKAEEDVLGCGEIYKATSRP